MTPFALSQAFVDEILAVSPMTMTSLGIPGADDRWDDLSQAGVAAVHDIRRRYRSEIGEHVDHSNPDERHAAVVLAGYLDVGIGEYEHGDHLRDLNHISCGFTMVRDIFDIMEKSTAEGWAAITSRLATVGRPLSGWCDVLEEGLDSGEVVARRQVESIIEQAENLAGDDSMFLGLAADAERLGFPSDDLDRAVETARHEAGAVTEWLRDRYLPHAVAEDGVGEERYVRSAERFLGMVLDPVETYEWGWDEIARLDQEMVEAAARLDPDATVGEVIEMIGTDPDRAVPRDRFTDFVQQRLDQAVSDLDGRHFEVPPPIRSITVSLAPPGGALGAWYVNPSVDWERPGSVWYALGDTSEVPTWQEVSTAYHEGFPGHHLQVGTSMYQSDRLSAAHRLFVWYSGYGEGWALYAERLMDELGYFDEPAYRLGMLASQMFRAVRVVVDIGSHLGLRIPHGAPLHPATTWTYRRAVDYIETVGRQPRDVSEGEVKRYLGWPGQAISYKVGEREILDIRRILEARDGFDLGDFHRRVLQGGELRLDHLRERMLT